MSFWRILFTNPWTLRWLFVVGERFRILIAVLFHESLVARAALQCSRYDRSGHFRSMNTVLNQPFFQVTLPLMVTFIATVWAATWSQNKRFEDLRADMNRRFDEFRVEMDRRFEEFRGDINRRFDEVLARLDRIEANQSDHA